MSQYTLHRVEDSVHRVEDTGYSTQNTDYRLQITVHRSQYTQNRIQDTVHRVEDTGYSTQIQKLVTNKQTNRKQTDSGVYRVAPTTKNFISQKMSFHVLRWGYPTSIDRFCCRS